MEAIERRIRDTVLSELQARYIGVFRETALSRLDKVLALLGEDAAHNAEKIRAELHSLVGEAGILGLTDVAKTTRTAEQLAKTMMTEFSPRLALQCARLARGLRAQVEVLEAMTESSSREIPLAERVSAVIVDDSDIVAGQLIDNLHEAGFSAVAASNADDALETIRKRRPRLVLLDVNVPGVDTGALCARVRELTRSTRVILVSALSPAELESLAGQIGADGFVSKTAGLDAIVRLVAAEVGDG